MNTADRLKVAQWVLERHLGWIAAADAKVAFVIAIDTAMLAALAAALAATHPLDRTAWHYFLTVSAAVANGLAIVFAAISVLPRTSGPDSLLFFERIVKRKSQEYVQAFSQATEAELLEDCTWQIHRNADIACAKFKWVRRAMWMSFVSAVPWVAALGLLVTS